jgi:16S rRNA (uracil1498-N3)-methyltransferase
VGDRRFYVLPSDVSSREVTLRAAEAHHARRVLRLEVGARIVCFDGLGSAWECEIVAFERDAARARAVARLADEPERRPRLTLAQGVLKGDRMDLVVQKATELGVARLAPIAAERSVARPEAGRVERWRRVALEAAKQCERNRLPGIAEPAPLGATLAEMEGAGLALVERDGAPLAGALDAIRGTPSVTLFVGPEGGWSSAEREAFARAGVAQASLGHNVLRAETAAIAAVAVVAFALGRE